MKNIIKNIVISLLVVLSVVQTGRLWFGVTVNHNFFYFFKSLILSSEDDFAEKSYLSAPYRIISKASANDYRIKYNDLEINLGKYNADLVLEELFTSGSFVGESDLSWPDVLKRNCIIYDYSIDLSSGTFAECLLSDVKSFKSKGQTLSSKVSSFSRIIFIPAKSSATNVTVLFINDALSKSYEFSVRVKKTVNDNLWLYIEDSELSDLQYTSSAESGITSSRENVFIPDFPSNGFVYHPVYAFNPYISSDGVRTLKSVEKEIASFFEDSPIKQVTPEDTSYRYSNDSNAVLKYNLTNDVLEYSNYSAVAKQNDNGLVANFSSAIKFINSDPNVINDFYLDSYIFDSDKHTFYFNYAIADFPLLLPDSVKSELGMSHVMEITVENQKVIKYKRLVMCLEADDHYFDVAALNYYDFLNTVYEFGADGDLNPRDFIGKIKLGYKYDKNMQLSLNWMMDLGGRSYIRPAR